MLNQILFKNQDKNQLIIAMIGSFMGIIFLIASIHYIIRVNEFGKGEEILGANTLIVQKKVSSASTLGLSKTDFTLREIEKMGAESFIEDIQPIQSNNFPVSFQTADPQVPYFRTEVFIQSIHKDFLDVNTDNWDWSPEDEFLPIVLPKEFLVLLNTFMSVQGMSQVTDELAMQVVFKLKLTDPTGRREFHKAKIIGFTNQVSSLLVPQSYMDYGMKNFSDGSQNKITQVLIKGKDGEFGLVEKMLKSRGLESKKSEQVIAKLKSIVSTLFAVVLGISIIAVFVSGLVLIQYLQLLLSKNAYEVRTLLRMGYAPNDLIKKFTSYFAVIFGIVSGAGLLVFVGLKLAVDNLFESGGMMLNDSMTITSIVSLIVAYGLFVLASYRNARKGIYNEY